jgi:ABC-type spermidine/putrescine transport system permease subunit I
MLPFAIVPIYASIERIDDSVLEAAATLGARPLSLFAEVIIPLSVPGIWAAGILVFIEAMGAFITPQLLGSASDMMIAQLVQERFIGSFDWPFGSAVAVIYLLFTGVAFAALFAGRQAIAGHAR